MNFTPYLSDPCPSPKFEWPEDPQRQRNQEEDVELETSLAVFHPKIQLSDLERVKGIAFPRDGCEYYRHRTKHLYLKCYAIPLDEISPTNLPYEWEDITNEYDWEKTQLSKTLCRYTNIPKMSDYKYSADNVDPYPTFVCPSEIQRHQIVETTLALWNPTMKRSDLEQLVDISFPRNCCKYYRHRTEHIFLKFGPSANGPMWEDVTNEYDWETTLSSKELCRRTV